MEALLLSEQELCDSELMLLNAITDGNNDGVWSAIGVYAEWLMEMGREEAIGWALIAERQRWPSFFEAHEDSEEMTSPHSYSPEWSWCMYWAPNRKNGGYGSSVVKPGIISYGWRESIWKDDFDKLTGVTAYNPEWKDYPTAIDALFDLARVWTPQPKVETKFCWGIDNQRTQSM